MYISIRNGTDVKTWSNLLSFASNEITFYLDEEGCVRQRTKTVFASQLIVSNQKYKLDEWTPESTILNYIQSHECKSKLESQGYKLYKIEEVII